MVISNETWYSVCYTVPYHFKLTRLHCNLCHIGCMCTSNLNYIFSDNQDNYRHLKLSNTGLLAYFTG